MKAILEFNLPEDQDEYQMCSEGVNTLTVLQNIMDNMRHLHKHEDLDGVSATDLLEDLIDSACIEIADLPFEF